MEIAGVRLHVNSLNMRLSPDAGTPYQSFTTQDKISPSYDISVDIAAMNNIDMQGIPLIFDSGQSWSMHKQDNTYYIAYNRPTPSNPFWVARGNQDFSIVTLFYNASIAGNGRDSGIIPNPVRYPLDQIILMHYLAHRGGIMVHASGIEINGKGYIFAGRSGAGKTTISTQFLARHYSGLLSDDRVIVRVIDHAFRVFGTPWPGEGGIASNTSAPLAGIFFLSHAVFNRIEELSPQRTIGKLLPVVSIPWYDRATVPDVLDFCSNLITEVPSYELFFKPDIEVTDVFQEFIS